jgi:hypothetical protein
MMADSKRLNRGAREKYRKSVNGTDREREREKERKKNNILF